MSKQKINKQHKDRVVKFIFGRNKAWALSLYNAINGSNYTNPEAIEFNTIDEILYIGMHNDVSFILYRFMQMLEQQSSFNPNMPDFFYTQRNFTINICSIITATDMGKN